MKSPTREFPDITGTATTNAVAGTWPSETLALSSKQPFNHVVVHYDKAPVTGGDYGTIFLADNMMVTPAPPPIVLTDARMLSSGVFQFAFSNAPNSTFTVLSATNPAPSVAQWSVLGPASEISPGMYQCVDQQATNRSPCFYRVRSP